MRREEYRPGDMFVKVDSNEIYILCRLGKSMHVLVSLDDGNRWRDPEVIETNSAGSIPAENMNGLMSPDDIPWDAVFSPIDDILRMPPDSARVCKLLNDTIIDCIRRKKLGAGRETARYVLSISKSSHHNVLGSNIELFEGGFDHPPNKPETKRKRWGAKEYNEFNEFHEYIDVEIDPGEFERIRKLLKKHQKYPDAEHKDE